MSKKTVRSKRATGPLMYLGPGVRTTDLHLVSRSIYKKEPALPKALADLKPFFVPVCNLGRDRKTVEKQIPKAMALVAGFHKVKKES